MAKLEPAPVSARLSDPLRGWAQSKDMNGQVRLHFETREEAVAYAQAHGIAFEILPDREPKKDHRQILR